MIRRFSPPHFPTPVYLTLKAGEETERRIEREARRWQRAAYLAALFLITWCIGYVRHWWGL